MRERGALWGAVGLARRRHLQVLGVVALLLMGALVLALGSARGATACEGGQTVSPDGTVVYGGPCSEKIIVEAPSVEAVYGGDGNDVIYVDPEVELVDGGAGDDVIYGELPEAPYEPTIPYEPEAPAGDTATASLEEISCAAKTASNEPCFGGPGSQKMTGGEGADRIFGQRGNDILLGEEGNDTLLAGIGDDKAVGGPGDDLVAGGYGTDELDGSNGNDLIRGDATGDELSDRGSEANKDTVSFATAASPGFHGEVGIAGFPADQDSAERGVSIDLEGNGCPGFQACNNSAIWGGGNDQIEEGAFENVIGSPFADLIVGSKVVNRIYGGGGTDLVYGEGGNDTLYGGAESDYLSGGAEEDTVFGQAGANHCVAVEHENDCSGGSSSVVPPAQGTLRAGLMIGSGNNDNVTVEYQSSSTGRFVKFKANEGSAEFNTAAEVQTAGCTYAPSEVTCPLAKKPDSLVLAGRAGEDRVAITGFEATASPVILGGEDGDHLFGSGSTEDVVVDGNGNSKDDLHGYKFDDALVNNEGAGDILEGGLGNDLLVSSTICEGDVLNGAEVSKGDEGDRNNASWAPKKEGTSGIVADIRAGAAGTANSSSGPLCGPGGTLVQLQAIDDLEGSNEADELFGDGAENSLFGRLGIDGIYARGGNDFINSVDGVFDSIGGGEGAEDQCKFDKELDLQSGCEIKEPE
jgi:Ca2+-binding RTX toxin-like protein